ncbi:MAG TPA: D-alanine--D-alanine ligase, partial [Thermodesulfobacteriota bacterium]|nr:D-alanine--D-alanine ligase [Thermodesulfobacteriota bacterium]
MMNVAILHDSVSESSSPDQVDVLLQAEAVSNALSELGFEPIPVSVSLDVQEVIKTIRHIKPAFVFNLVECIHGRGHLIHLIPS